MNKKTILGKIKELFNTDEKFGADYKTTDGRIIRCYGEGLDVGEMVKEITADGEVDLPNGDYELEDGLMLNVVDGKITNITEQTEAEDLEIGIDDVENSISMEDKDMVEKDKMMDLDTTLMDGTKVRVIGGLLAIGSRVQALIDGKYINAPEGQHNLIDGVIIYVDADGLINEIETPDTKKEEEEGMAELFNSLSSLINEVKKLRVEVKSIKEENKTMKNDFNKFSKSPSEAPTNHEIKFSKTSKYDKLKLFAR
jgi:hypothetical protein